MRHVSRTHRVALDWLFDRINLDPKIQIKYIDTKNQLADILTKGNFTRDERNHLLCLFNISHFSSTVCSDTMAKRSQQNFGGERVTAKSRPMMNLVAGTPSHVSSSTSVSPWKRSYGSQDPGIQLLRKKKDRGDLIKAQIYSKPPIIITMINSWKAFLQQVVQSVMTSVLGLLKSGKLKLRRTNHRGDLIKTSWKMIRKVRPGHEEILLYGTAQSVRNEETLRDRSGRPEINSQEEARPQQFVVGNDETELELSVESRSFVNRVDDQVRKRQKKFPMLQEMERNILLFGECLWL